jgi:hypothetical protein
MEIQVFNENYECAYWHGGNFSYLWPLDGFRYLHHVEFDVQFAFFLKIYEVT